MPNQAFGSYYAMPPRSYEDAFCSLVLQSCRVPGARTVRSHGSIAYLETNVGYCLLPCGVAGTFALHPGRRDRDEVGVARPNILSSGASGVGWAHIHDLQVS